MSRDISSVVKHVLDKRNLYEALFLATVRCNAKCEFCCEQGKESDTPIDTMVTYIKPLVTTLGAKLIDVNGGEPLLRGNTAVLRLMEEANRYGARGSLSSNLLRLNDALITQMKPFADIVNCSLHGTEDETNDRIMSVPGASSRIKRNIGKLVDNGYDVHLTCVATDGNFTEIPHLARWCYDNGVRTFCMNLLFGRGRGSSQLMRKQPDVDDLITLRDELRETYPPSRLNIYANLSHIGQCILVRPDGMLYGAPQNPRSSEDGLVPVGHVFDEDVRDKWDAYQFRDNHHLYNIDKFAPYLLGGVDTVAKGCLNG